jgi:hypothetical protein
MHATTTSMKAAVVAFLAMAASACGSSVAVDHWIAPPVDIAGNRHVVVTDAYGRAGSVDAVAGMAVDALRQSLWFTDVQDLSRRDRLETDGYDAWLRHGDLRSGALYVRLDVLEDSAVATANERVVDNGDGTTSIVLEETLVAHTLISLTVADDLGVVVDELEVEGIHEVLGDTSGAAIDAAMFNAAQVAVAAALAHITPTLQRVNVPVDDRDDDVMATIAGALDGSFAQRAAAADALADDDRTPAVYNRAVLLESIGERRLALAGYRVAADAADAPSFAGRVYAEAIDRMAAARALGLEN